jgi:predicted aspartyl protease
MSIAHISKTWWPKAAALVAMFLTLFTLTGCGQQASINDPAVLAVMKTRFAAGDAMMLCRLNCSGNYGYHRQELYQDYTTQNWDDMVDTLLTIGNDNDQSWFYLASAAEGLGYHDAAQKYYLRSLNAHYPCKGIINLCDGLDLPNLTFARLAALDDRLLASPEYAMLTTPPYTGSAPVQIHLSKTHGLLQAPVLLDDKMPLLFTVDSGASAVVISSSVAAVLFKDGVLNKSDIMGHGTSVLGDGSLAPLLVFKIHSLRIGNVVVHDVIGNISFGPGQLLLGQTFFDKFKSWSIDNSQSVLQLQR